ncbi:APC family permease [Pseudomonas aeruginosa]|uniref:amino acid permease n=1 Tax=Pseudomonas aeruginosa TaxID=287 RepID=UPI003D283F80
MYWVNNALWMPSVYTLFGSMLGAFYFPELSLWGKIAIGIALALLTAAFNVVALRLGKWLPNLGALLKLLAVLALGVGGLHFGWNHGFANDFSLDSIVPSSPGQMAALGVMVYGIMGTELACLQRRGDAQRAPRHPARGADLRADRRRLQHLRHPRRAGRGTGRGNRRHPDLRPYPLQHLRPRRRRRMLADLVGAFVLFTLFTNMVTWSMGTNRAAVEAAKAGELPALFGVVHSRHGTPIGSAVLASAVSIVLLLLYGLVAHTAEELFWTLLSIFAMVFMMPYVLMCLAFVRLRRADPRPRPYRMPLGDRLASLWALFVALHVLAGICLFVVTPGAPMDWAYAGKIVGGVALALAVGELLIRQAARRRGVMSLRGAYG